MKQWLDINPCSAYMSSYKGVLHTCHRTRGELSLYMVSHYKLLHLLRLLPVIALHSSFDSGLLLLLFAFQSMFISIWVSRLEIAEFPDSVRRSAPYV